MEYVKVSSVLIATTVDPGLYLNAITVSLFWVFFFIKNSSMLKCLGVLEGQKLLCRKTRCRLDFSFICIFVESTEHV